MKRRLWTIFLTISMSISLLCGCGSDEAMSINEGKNVGSTTLSEEKKDDTGSDETQTTVEIEAPVVVEQYMVNGHEVSKEEYERQKALDKLEQPGEIADKNDEIEDSYTDVDDLRNADGSGKIIYHYGDGHKITYEKDGDTVSFSRKESTE